MALTDESIFPYGKYKNSGTKMEDVPDHYLRSQFHYFSKKEVTPNSPVDQVLGYVRDNWDVLGMNKRS